MDGKWMEKIINANVVMNFFLKLKLTRQVLQVIVKSPWYVEAMLSIMNDCPMTSQKIRGLEYGKKSEL